MGTHSLYYYPYGAFGESQRTLLNCAALYFDSLHVLDPERASTDECGKRGLDKELRLLEAEGILHRIAPAEVLQRYEEAITRSILTDVQDPAFLSQCKDSGLPTAWRLALAKVPKPIREHSEHPGHDRLKPLDEAMQRLLGELPHSLPDELQPRAYYRETFSIGGQEFEDVRFLKEKTAPIGNEILGYRYADYPLPLGESIMLNHALFGALGLVESTPITDDPFHMRVLALKLRRARDNPELRRAIDALGRKADLLAIATITDVQLNLPVIVGDVALQDVLEYRLANRDALAKVRERLEWLAREIRDTPWTPEFESDVQHSRIPAIAKELQETQKAQSSWMKTKRGRLAISASGVAVSAAAAVAGFILTPTPALPIGLGLLGSAGFPAAAIAMEWKEAKATTTQNGLHYLLQAPRTFV